MPAGVTTTNAADGTCLWQMAPGTQLGVYQKLATAPSAKSSAPTSTKHAGLRPHGGSACKLAAQKYVSQTMQ